MVTPFRSRLLAAAVAAFVLATPLIAQVSSRPGMGAVPYSGGTTFRVFAPFASAVTVAGPFNSWSASANPLYSEGNGNWSVDIAGVTDGAQYKYVLTTGAGTLWKNDPRARELTNSTGDSIVRGDTFDWSVYGPSVNLFSAGFESGSLGVSWATSGSSTWRVECSGGY